MTKPGDWEYTQASDEWLREERKHEREVARIRADERLRRRNDLKELAGWVVAGLTTVLVVACVALLIYKLAANSSANNTKRDEACFASGGTRITTESGSALCIHVTEVPQ